MSRVCYTPQGRPRESSQQCTGEGFRRQGQGRSEAPAQGTETRRKGEAEEHQAMVQEFSGCCGACVRLRAGSRARNSSSPRRARSKSGAPPISRLAKTPASSSDSRPGCGAAVLAVHSFCAAKIGTASLFLLINNLFVFDETLASVCSRHCSPLPQNTAVCQGELEKCRQL